MLGGWPPSTTNATPTATHSPSRQRPWRARRSAASSSHGITTYTFTCGCESQSTSGADSMNAPPPSSAAGRLKPRAASSRYRPSAAVSSFSTASHSSDCQNGATVASQLSGDSIAFCWLASSASPPPL